MAPKLLQPNYCTQSIAPGKSPLVYPRLSAVTHQQNRVIQVRRIAVRRRVDAALVKLERLRVHEHREGAVLHQVIGLRHRFVVA